jgi:hypothetical protein
MDRRLQALLSSDDRAVSARPSLSLVSHPTQCLARSLDGRHCSPLFEYFGVCRPKEALPVPPFGGRLSPGNHMDPSTLVGLFRTRGLGAQWIVALETLVLVQRRLLVVSI